MNSLETVTDDLILKAPQIDQALTVMKWWHFLVIIGSLLIAILIILFFINKITCGNFELGFIRTKKKDQVNPHSTCIHKDSLLTIFRRISETTIKIHEIKSRGILSYQMVKTEEFLLSIKDTTLTYISHGMEETSPQLNPDYLHFKLVLQECISRVKDIIRVACINNGFHTMDPKSYEGYLEDICQRICGMTSRFFIENYSGKTEISKILNQTYMKKIQIIIRDLFILLKKISEDKNQEIKLLEEKQNKIFSIELGYNR